MRRFLHRKGSQAHLDGATANTGAPGNIQGISPTGRPRAPKLRSRSMSVLSGPEPSVVRSRKFTRSLSFCIENQRGTDEQHSPRKVLSQTEEDEVFQMYTKRVYFTVGALCAIVTGFIIYAYVYNTAGKGN